MTDSAFGKPVNKLRLEFVEAMRAKDTLMANNIALRACDLLFPIDPEKARAVVWKKFYRRLKGRAVPYQCTDFESVDYQLWLAPGLKKLMRGPNPDVERAGSNYVTFLGASQFFGRHIPVAVHAFVEKASGLHCVNLAAPGAAPGYFDSPEILQVAKGGRAVVLQVLSGKGVGGGQFPGGDVTVRRDGSRVKRMRLIREIHDKVPRGAIRLVRKWQEHYVTAMQSLIRHLEVPVILVWMSSRQPQDWSVEHLGDDGWVGAFPQIIDQETLDRIKPGCAAFVEVSRDEGIPYKFVSRFTGELCPTIHAKKDGQMIWENSYYPSTWAAEEVSRVVCAALDSLGIRA